LERGISYQLRHGAEVKVQKDFLEEKVLSWTLEMEGSSWRGGQGGKQKFQTFVIHPCQDISNDIPKQSELLLPSISPFSDGMVWTHLAQIPTLLFPHHCQTTPINYRAPFSTHTHLRLLKAGSYHQPIEISTGDETILLSQVEFKTQHPEVLHLGFSICNLCTFQQIS
jgi:hypothetical protein